MKKILTIFIILSLVTPMIIVKAEDNVIEFRLENPIIKFTEGQLITEIEGFVINKNTESISNLLNGQKIIDNRTGVMSIIEGGHFKISVVISKIGRFNLDLVLSDLVKMIGSNYYLDVNKNGSKDLNEFIVNNPFYAVVPHVELNEELAFKCGVNGYVSISGRVKEAPLYDIGIRYKGENFIDTKQLNKGGYFGFIVNNKLDFDHGGELELVLEMRDEYDPGDYVLKKYEVVLATGVVEIDELDAKLSISNIPKGVFNSGITIEITDLKDVYLENSRKLNENYTFEAKMFNGKDEEITEVSKTSLLYSLGLSRDLKFSPFNVKALNKLDVGNYNIVVNLKRVYQDGKVVNELVHQKKLQISITPHEGNMLIGEKLLNDRDCGVLSLDLGGENSRSSDDDLVFYYKGKAIKPYKDKAVTMGGYVLKYNAPGQRQTILHTLCTDEDKKTKYPEKLPIGLSESKFMGINKSLVDIPLYQGGDFRYTLDIYVLENNLYKKVYSSSNSFKISGYKVSVSLDEAIPNKNVDISINVKDNNDNNINNSIIYIGKDIYGVNHPEKLRPTAYALDDNGIYNGRKGLLVNNISVNNGWYSIENVSFNETGYINIVVYRLNKDNTVTRMAVLKDAILVKGIDTWSVKVNHENTEPGQNKIYYLNVKDGNNKIIVPHSIDILEDGIGWKTLYKSEIESNMTSKGIKIEYTCRNDTFDEITFVPRNENNSNTGIASVKVIRPEISYENKTEPVITQDFYTNIKFSIVNPVTNEKILRKIYYRLNNCGSEAEGGLYYSNNVEAKLIDDINPSLIYNFYCLVKNINYENNKYSSETPSLSIYIKTDNNLGDIKIADIPIKKAEISTIPSQITEDVKEIQIMLIDGMGYPIKDKLIKVNFKKYGYTNDYGSIHHYITTKAKTLNVLAETDVKYRFVNLEIPIIKKESSQGENKIASAPEIVKQPRVTVRINHKHNILQLRVNDIEQKITKPINFYMAKVTDLKPGNNEILIQLFDKQHMSYVEKINVFYEVDFEPISFKIGEKGKYGTPILINGTTMVPVRFAKELGADMSWNNYTNTVSYKRGNKEISMTVGRNYAMVNGEIKELKITPYFNTEKRVMVPLRMVADELGFRVKWNGVDNPIQIRK